MQKLATVPARRTPKHPRRPRKATAALNTLRAFLNIQGVALALLDADCTEGNPDPELVQVAARLGLPVHRVVREALAHLPS
jgi:hypothetical protein